MEKPNGHKTYDRELLYKILMVGDIGSGKTSFIKRYVNNIYTDKYKSTIGVDFALKQLHWDDSTMVRLQLWDIAGQERFGNMTRVYYKESVGGFIVFDITRPTTFENVIKWKEDLDKKVVLFDKPIPVVLIANKIDLDSNDEWTSDEVNVKLDNFCRENNFVGWFKTSAKDNIGIEEAVKTLVKNIISLVGDEQPWKSPGSFIIKYETFNKTLDDDNDNGRCNPCVIL